MLFVFRTVMVLLLLFVHLLFGFVVLLLFFVVVCFHLCLFVFQLFGKTIRDMLS